MKLITCLIVATVAAMAAASDVIVLTEANFEAEVKKHDLMLIEFYAPWCGHCKSLEPEYDAAAPILKKNDPPVALAKVDATENGELARRFGVSGYPTLKIFRSGALSGAYEGGRKSADIVAYMKKQTGPSSIEVTSIDQAEAVFAKGDVVVFGLFAQSTDELLSAFNQVADSNRELFTFMHTSEIEVMNKYGFRSNVVVYQPKHLYNKFEEKHAIYQGSPHTKSLEQFIIASGSSLVAHVDTDSQKRFDKKVSQLGLPVVTAYYDVDYRKNPKGTNYWRNRVLKVAQDFKKSFVFGVRNSEEFAREVDEFNLKGKTVGISIKHDGKKYSMKTEFSMDALRSFLEEYNGGNMKETVKSEAVPETQGDVRVVVGETFKEEVLLNDDDVLIEFYAPWCGHCKKLEPIYNELAAKLKHNSKLRIAKMDATANDFPRSQFAVSGYPTIYFVPGNDKSKALKYEGDRDVAGFTAYLKKNAHHKLTKKKKAKTDL